MTTRTENMLLEDCERQGLVGIRLKDAMSGTGHDPGDVWVGRFHAGAGPWIQDNGPPVSELYIVEEKYKKTTSNRYLQEDGDKFDQMISFAEAIGATPVLALRWSTRTDWSPGSTHYLKDARKVERTDADNVNVSPMDVQVDEEWLPTAKYF